MIITQCIHEITTSYGLMGSMLLAGLVGGFTHCAGMCAPFVLAQTSYQTANGHAQDLTINKLKSSLLIPYHAGRMTTYVFLAILVGSVVNLAFLYSNLKSFIAVPMLVLAAIIFLVSAFPKLASIFPWIGAIRFNMPYKIVTSLSSRFIENPSVGGRYALGVLLGFMPCGLVVAALLASATAPSVFSAALAMMAFTIGTIPALFLVSFGGQSLIQKYPGLTTKLSRGAMTISALWLFLLAGFIVI